MSQIHFDDGIECIEVDGAERAAMTCLVSPNRHLRTFSENVFVKELNLIMDLGIPALRLAARIHGQCEIHGYVEGKNRDWFADMLYNFSLSHDYAFIHTGWRKAEVLARARNDRPLVSSYSVTDLFPAYPIPVDYENEARNRRWDKHTDFDRWRLGLRALRRNRLNLEWKPENWETYRF